MNTHQPGHLDMSSRTMSGLPELNKDSYMMRGATLVSSYISTQFITADLLLFN